MEVRLLLKQAERAAKGKCEEGIDCCGSAPGGKKKKNQHKGQKVAAQQDTSVAAPSNIWTSCKKFVVTSHGIFSHFLQTSWQNPTT